MQEYGVST
uniref:Uncharacterized protein n=1 Tax=Moniliophthora roreri TaxID=221103 RepID=A0A0W0ETU3_MONRR